MTSGYSYDANQVHTITVTCDVCGKTYERTITHGVRVGPCLACVPRDFQIARRPSRVDVNGLEMTGPMKTRILLALACLLAGSCATHHPVIPQPERYLLPYVSPNAIVCLQQGPDRWSCIRAGDLRKLLASMGNS